MRNRFWRGDSDTDGMEHNVKAQTVTVREAAKLLGIGRNLAYEGVQRGEIPAIRIGNRILVPQAGIERLLNGQ